MIKTIAFILLAATVATAPLRAAPLCETDLRIVELKKGKTAEIQVRIVREYKEVTAIEGRRPVIPLREDARVLDARWTKSFLSPGYINNASVSNDGVLSIDKNLRWAPLKVTKKGVALPRGESGKRFLVDITFSISSSMGPDLWWVSYVSPKSTALRAVAVRLHLPATEKVAITADPGLQVIRQQSGARKVLTWRQQFEAAPANPVSLLVGSAVSWPGLASRMKVSVMAPGPLPKNEFFGRCRDYGALEDKTEALKKVFNELHAFEKREPSLGLAARPVAETLRTKKGNCKDLSALLVGGLRSAGMSPALVFRSSTVDDVAALPPCPFLFDHVLVAVRHESETVFLDPTLGTMTRTTTAPVSRDGVAVWNNSLIVNLSK